MLFPYVLKAFAGQINELKLDDDGITPMENFADTTTDITLKITTHVFVQFMSWVYY